MRAALWIVLLAIVLTAGCEAPPPEHPAQSSPEHAKPCCQYIDKTGAVVIQPKFAMTAGSDFKEGLAGVRNEAGKFGFIDKTGAVVIPFEFQDGTDHSEGVAGVLKDNMCGFIDKKGKLIVPLRYDTVTNFHQGWGIGERRGRYVVFVNVRGEEMPQHFSTVESFSEGLAAVAPLPTEEEEPGDTPRHGFIDTSGKMVIPAIYEDAEPFSEGYAAVKLHGKWGYVDKTGAILVTPQYELAGPFSEGYGQVVIDGKMGYIDKTGNIVIPPRFETDQFIADPDEKPQLIGQFVNGLAAVRHSIGAEAELGWGFIDTKGKFVIPPIYEDAYMFTEGLARVQKGGKWGFIDPTGKMVIPARYSRANSFSEGLALVHND